ncbi:MAG: NPCBM/NEW2 domain-containing protein [Armatimonadota bacterium]
MKYSLTVCMALGMMSVLVPSVAADKPSPNRSEMAQAQSWVADNFKRIKKSGEAPSPVKASKYSVGLNVLENHDPIAQNKRPDGIPIKIGKIEFQRGLLCHANSKVVVRLPGPGKTFSSIVGIHSDAGGGSVIFSVKAGEKEVFRSSVLHCGDDGVPVNVTLDGVQELTLEVGDSGDGITCDQSDWADAKVILENGNEIWLGDMPVITHQDVHDRKVMSPAFSFIYGNMLSDDLLGSWKFSEHVRKLDVKRKERAQIYTDPDTGLEMRIVIIQYNDYPTVEWTVYFKNTGKQDTPILEGILPLDMRISKRDQDEFILHHNVGTPYSPEDYKPLETKLEPNSKLFIGAAGGRPMNTDMPYFNLQWGKMGMIVVLGWTGQWISSFIRDNEDGVRIAGGQEMTHFKLHPGEEVRTPLVVIQFWTGGDLVRSQNIWRRWMRAYNLPRQEGEPLKPVLSGAGADLFPELIDTVSDEITLLDGHVQHKLNIDYWWRDAGWYPCGNSWANTGTWEPDPVRYPKGLRELADQIHKNKMKFIVWFEPERVTPSSWLAENHPEWVFGGKGGGLLKLGDPDAWNWVVNHVDGLITSQGIDMYRQDFNMDPLSFWRANDTPDRQGITEIKHIEGLLAYWDELKRRHPKMPFDCCASGGRRNDLEMMRRGVPLSKTDYCGGTISSQCQLYGISSWLPYYGAGLGASQDMYVLRSNIAPWSAECWDTRNPDLNYPLLRQFVSEWRKVSPYLLNGDYYPLTRYELSENVWMAWQFDVPETGEGVVQAFRREASIEESMTYKLQNLIPDATYLLTDFDTNKPLLLTGRELMVDGLTIKMTQCPWAKIITYKKVD